MEFYKGIILIAGMFSITLGCLQDFEKDLNDCEVQLSKTKLDMSTTFIGDIPNNEKVGSPRDTCSAFEEFKSCVDSRVTPCWRGIVLRSEGYKNLFIYICGEGRRQHLQYQTCLSNMFVHGFNSLCTVNAFQQVNFAGPTDENVCGPMKKAIGCVEKLVKANCGSEVAEHQVKLEKLYLQPFAEEIDCSLVADGDTNVGLIVGLVVAVVVWILVMIAVAIYCVMRNKKKAHEQEQGQQQNQINMVSHAEPAPYSQYIDPNSVHPSYTMPHAAMGIN